MYESAAKYGTVEVHQTGQPPPHTCSRLGKPRLDSDARPKHPLSHLIRRKSSRPTNTPKRQLCDNDPSLWFGPLGRPTAAPPTLSSASLPTATTTAAGVSRVCGGCGRILANGSDRSFRFRIARFRGYRWRSGVGKSSAGGERL